MKTLSSFFRWEDCRQNAAWAVLADIVFRVSMRPQPTCFGVEDVRRQARWSAAWRSGSPEREVPANSHNKAAPALPNSSQPASMARLAERCQGIHTLSLHRGGSRGRGDRRSAYLRNGAVLSRTINL